jgi:hypothetical protein
LHLDFEGLREDDTQPSSSFRAAKRAVRVTVAANPGGRLGIVFGCGDADGRPVVRRFDPVRTQSSLAQ